jgi:glycogen synthase
MRIAFLSQEVPGINDEGGIGYHFLLLGRAFTKRGHDVTLFYDGEKELEIDGVKIKGVWRKSWM